MSCAEFVGRRFWQTGLEVCFYRATKSCKYETKGQRMTETADYSAAALLASPVRRALVEALERQPEAAPEDPTPTGAGDPGATTGRTAAELAPVVGLHVTTVRFHLDQLVAAGVLEAGFRRQTGAGRPRKVYSLRAGRPGPTAVPRARSESEPLRLLAALLVEAMSVQGESMTPEEAGRQWAREHIDPGDDAAPAGTAGTWLGKVGRMIDVLDEWGYHPALSTDEGGRTARVELTDCPFLDLARANTAVVCGVHQGLIAEGMRRFGEPDAEVRLDPFVGPARCLAHIRRAAPFHTSAATPATTAQADAAPPDPTATDAGTEENS
jgi:predicted ArsR family transcriptional regulator